MSQDLLFLPTTRLRQDSLSPSYPCTRRHYVRNAGIHTHQIARHQVSHQLPGCGMKYDSSNSIMRLFFKKQRGLSVMTEGWSATSPSLSVGIASCSVVLLWEAKNRQSTSLDNKIVGGTVRDRLLSCVIVVVARNMNCLSLYSNRKTLLAFGHAELHSPSARWHAVRHWNVSFAWHFLLFYFMPYCFTLLYLFYIHCSVHHNILLK